MPWLNGRIKGRPNIERDLYPSQDALDAAIAGLVRRYREKGARERDVMAGPMGATYVCEIHKDGEMIARYWVSGEGDSEEPLERG